MEEEMEMGCRVTLQEVLDIQFEYIHIEIVISNAENA